METFEKPVLIATQFLKRVSFQIVPLWRLNAQVVALMLGGASYMEGRYYLGAANGGLEMGRW